MSLQLEDYFGAVPVIIFLSDTDCTVQEKPPPLTYVLPRSTVLLAVREEVQKFFSLHTVVRADVMPFVWLTYKDEPVPWQYPVGAIKDSVNAAVIAGLSDTPTQYFCEGPTQPSPAELYPTVFSSPLSLEVRITYIATEKPLTISCPGQEDAVPSRSGEQAVREYMKQVLKGTFSAMYGGIKALMDARSEVVNDMLNFTMCTSTGDAFVQAMRAYNDRISGLRRVTGDPKNIVLMMNMPFGKNPLRFVLFRVPITDLCGGNVRGAIAGDEEDVSSCDDKMIDGSKTGDDVLKDGDRKPRTQLPDILFGEVVWRALLDPYLNWRRLGQTGSADMMCMTSLFLSLSPFYDGLEDVSCCGNELSSRTKLLVRKFIAAGDATTEEKMIRVTLPTSSLKRRFCPLVQGLQPAFRTPVEFLLEHFASADGRLYVTLALL